MKRKSGPLLLIAAICTIIACKKDNHVPVNPSLPDSDVREIKLKSIETTGLPSPYFHFTYDDSGYAKQINFASNFFMYQLQYENKRLKKMTNSINGDYLLYSYNNGFVNKVTVVSGVTGKKLRSYILVYNSKQLLKEVKWFGFGASDNDSTLERRVQLFYDASNNLGMMEDYRITTTPEPVWSSTIEYSDYDDGKNVEGFFLFKDFFDHLVFLPQVTLQKGNPKKILMSSATNEFVITNQYEYNGKLPVKRNTETLQTKGSEAGKRIQTSSQFTYY